MKKKYLILSLLLSGFPFAAYVGAQDTLTINFTGMDTLENQNVYVSVYDVENESEVGRSSYVVGSLDSSVVIEGITAGGPYYVDFFADKNNNGRYDAPPDDEAWRIVLDSLVAGDTTITFAYNNTSFTDIEWRNRLRLEFTGMDTLEGKNLYLSLRNSNGEREIEVDTFDNVTSDFDFDFFDVEADSSYQIVFFADMDDNAKYDTADQAWLINLYQLQGDTIIPFMYNTNFANDIVWFADSVVGPEEPYTLTVNFSDMAQSVGKTLTFFVKELDDLTVSDSLAMPIDSAEFIVIFDSLMTSTDYNLDFYVDMNDDSTYNAPPVDHAWRIELTNIQGDTIIDFVHNTDFTDILSDTAAPGDTTNYTVTVEFTGYTENVGQNFTVYLVNPDDNVVVDSITVTPIDTADFTIVFESVEVQPVYNIDFYVDVNSNGSYDVPPTDQSWRIVINNIDADTTINFIYDTNYTDITIITTGVDEVESKDVFSAYPNPARDELTVNLYKNATGLNIYNLTGALVMQYRIMPGERILKLNVANLKPGMYLLRVDDGKKFSQQKFLKE